MNECVGSIVIYWEKSFLKLNDFKTKWAVPCQEGRALLIHRDGFIEWTCYKNCKKLVSFS